MYIGVGSTRFRCLKTAGVHIDEIRAIDSLLLQYGDARFGSVVSQQVVRSQTSFVRSFFLFRTIPLRRILPQGYVEPGPVVCCIAQPRSQGERSLNEQHTLDCLVASPLYRYIYLSFFNMCVVFFFLSFLFFELPKKEIKEIIQVEQKGTHSSGLFFPPAGESHCAHRFIDILNGIPREP